MKYHKYNMKWLKELDVSNVAKTAIEIKAFLSLSIRLFPSGPPG